MLTNHILVRQNIRKCFRFVIDRKTYQFRVLPFGLSTAPREFTKTLAPLVQLLRTRGIRVHAYLDDWIIRADTPELCIQHTQETIQLLISLGWTINWKKSILEPTCILDFLGLHFNLEPAIVCPPNSFIETLTSVLSRLSTSTVMFAHKVTSINGRIFHYAPFIHHRRLQIRFLQFWIKNCWSQHPQPWDSQIQLDTEYVSHLWWFNRPAVLRGVPLHAPEPSLFFFYRRLPDRMGSRLAGASNLRTMVSSWAASTYQLAGVGSCQISRSSGGPQWHNQTVRVYCDNSTAVVYIRKQGRTHSLSLFHKTLELFHLLDQFVILLIPTHLPGARNVTADALSHRNSPSSTEWHPGKEGPWVNLSVGRQQNSGLFLLCSGIVALKGKLEEMLFGHFVTFHVAITVLSSKELSSQGEFRNYPSKLLKLFAEFFGKLYGHEMMVYNVHNLIHLPKCVSKFGPLETFSSFPFDNFLKQLQAMIRNARYPLQQIVRRLHGRKAVKNHKSQKKSQVSVRRNT